MARAVRLLTLEAALAVTVETGVVSRAGAGAAAGAAVGSDVYTVVMLAGVELLLLPVLLLLPPTDREELTPKLSVAAAALEGEGVGLTLGACEAPPTILACSSASAAYSLML